MKKSGWANPITEITLFVADLQRSKVFYQETFQLAIHYEDADCTVFNFGNTCINLLNENNAPELIEPAQVGRVGEGRGHGFCSRSKCRTLTGSVPNWKSKAFNCSMARSPVRGGGGRPVLQTRTVMYGRSRRCFNDFSCANQENECNKDHQPHTAGNAYRVGLILSAEWTLTFQPYLQDAPQDSPSSLRHRGLHRFSLYRIPRQSPRKWCYR